MRKELAQSTIMPILVMFALSSSPGFEVVLEAFGIPSKPWIILFWESIFPEGSFPQYAIEYSNVLFFLSFAGAVVKFVMDWSVYTNPDGITKGDRGAVMFIFLSSVFLLVPLQGIEITTVVVTHLGIIFGLNVLFTFIPSVALDMFSDDTTLSRFMIFLTILGLSLILTYIGSLVMIWITF